MVQLSVSQDIQEKLYKEITKIYGDNIPEFTDLEKLEYLFFFIQEVLRCYPPVAVLPTRIATVDAEFEGFVIPKGTLVGVDIRTIHRNPLLWSEPDEFIPERHIQENKKGMPQFSFLPFSLGPRQCLGTQFSIMEQRLFLIRLLQRFKILPPENNKPRDLKVAYTFGISLDHYVKLVPRK